MKDEARKELNRRLRRQKVRDYRWAILIGIGAVAFFGFVATDRLLSSESETVLEGQVVEIASSPSYDGADHYAVILLDDGTRLQSRVDVMRGPRLQGKRVQLKRSSGGLFGGSYYRIVDIRDDETAAQTQ